ncbi:hypothetical protein SNE40_007100 [Patella caerulea]|uniref:CCHC-type domain-containing protein n=1 Tax=Patella caerulea TaxID=87958 RepID=A0AAN8K3Y7_PATCE
MASKGKNTEVAEVNQPRLTEIEDLRTQLQLLKASLDDFQQKEPRERLVFAPRERRIERFSGVKGTVSVYEFREEVTRSLKARPTSLEEKVEFILGHLDGPAKEELRYRPAADKKNPEEILDLLVEVFGERSSVTELLGQFYQTKQDEKQSLTEFSHILMEKLDRIFRVDPKMTLNRDIMLRDQFAENVSDKWLRRELKRKTREHPQISFADLREEANLCSTDIDINNNKPKKCVDVPSYVMKSDKDPVETLLKELTSEVVSLKKEVNTLRSNPTTSKLCYKCHEPGHFKRNCPKLGHLNEQSLSSGASR